MGKTTILNEKCMFKYEKQWFLMLNGIFTHSLTWNILSQNMSETHWIH
jgi:hypothetical protein